MSSLGAPRSERRYAIRYSPSEHSQSLLGCNTLHYFTRNLSDETRGGIRDHDVGRYLRRCSLPSVGCLLFVRQRYIPYVYVPLSESEFSPNRNSSRRFSETGLC